MSKQIATKKVLIDGVECRVRVFESADALRGRISRSREAAHNGDELAFEREREAQAEARHLGIDLGPGYSAS